MQRRAHQARAEATGTEKTAGVTTEVNLSGPSTSPAPRNTRAVMISVESSTRKSTATTSCRAC
jgi:hypothetical protein